MNKKEKEQLLNLFKQGIECCIVNQDFTSLQLKIEILAKKQDNIKLLRKWVNEAQK